MVGHPQEIQPAAWNPHFIFVEQLLKLLAEIVVIIRPPWACTADYILDPLRHPLAHEISEVLRYDILGGEFGDKPLAVLAGTSVITKQLDVDAKFLGAKRNAKVRGGN